MNKWLVDHYAEFLRHLQSYHRYCSVDVISREYHKQQQNRVSLCVRCTIALYPCLFTIFASLQEDLSTAEPTVETNEPNEVRPNNQSGLKTRLERGMCRQNDADDA